MELLSIVLNFVLASGLAGTLMFYRPRRRRESADADSAEIQNRNQEIVMQRDTVRFLGQQLQEAYAEVDKLQELVNRKRDEIIELIRRCKQLEIELIDGDTERRKAAHYACYDPDCPYRKPGPQPQAGERKEAAQ